MIPKKHFTSTAIVIHQNKVLLVKHKKLGVWLPPGGHVEQNERPDHCCLRELYEECAIHARILPNRENGDISDEYALVMPNPLTILLEDINQQGTHFHIDMIYCCQLISIDDKHLAEYRGENIGWFSADALPSPMYHNAIHLSKYALKKYASY